MPEDTGDEEKVAEEGEDGKERVRMGRKGRWRAHSIACSAALSRSLARSLAPKLMGQCKF